MFEFLSYYVTIPYTLLSIQMNAIGFQKWSLKTYFNSLFNLKQTLI